MATVIEKQVTKDIRSLRAALAWLDTQGDLMTTDVPVDPDLEITGIQKHLDGGPVVLFNNVKGKPHARVITNLFSDIQVVNKLFGFTTPMDRDDILTLAHSLDQIVDLAEEVSDRIDLYDVGAITDPAKQLGECLAQAGREVAKAAASLDDFRGLDPVLQEVHRLENEGDAITRRALHELLDENHRTAADLIKWKDVYALLESTLDECEEVAEIIETIAIKNA